MPRSPKPPEFLVDRSLGRYMLPNALRTAGYTVHTLSSVYGEPTSQQIRDPEWLRDAGQNSWIVLCKDDSIRRNRLELAAVEQYAVKVFCITSARLTGEQQRDRVLHHINRIIQRAMRPGPYIYGIYDKGLRLLWRP